MEFATPEEMEAMNALQLGEYLLKVDNYFERMSKTIQHMHKAAGLPANDPMLDIIEARRHELDKATLALRKYV
jgi:hypothetical protein